MLVGKAKGHRFHGAHLPLVWVYDYSLLLKFPDAIRPDIEHVEFSNKGEMLYAGMPDLIKKESMLMMNYGESKIILNRKKFDDI
ncbi:MAG: hypothetical protein MUP04_00905, partial [Anaerolineae bacterium]|nr:hypothetical protein [Anaerolineae bacterium]